MTGATASRPSGEPLVSVVIPVRNAGVFLSAALDSVLQQSYRKLEVLILDDGSSDGSLEQATGLRDRRVRVLGDSRLLGVTARLNQGIAAASGRYIARMDADDICSTDRIERQVAAMEADDGIAVLGTAAAFIDESGRITGVTRRAPPDDRCLAWRLITDNCIVHPTTMLRSRIAKEHGYQETYPFAQDYELWLRLAAKGFRLAILPQVLLLLRRHSSAVTSTKRTEQLQMAARALREHLQSVFDAAVDESMALALVEPPAWRSPPGDCVPSSLSLLADLANRLLEQGAAAGDPGFAAFVRQDVGRYAARYVRRALSRRPPERALREVKDLRAAVGVVARHCPGLLMDSLQELAHHRRGIMDARKIALDAARTANAGAQVADRL